MAEPIKIIDVHSHYGKWGRHFIYGNIIEPFAHNERDSYEKILDFMQKNRIDQVVLVPTYSLNHVDAFKLNYEVVTCAERLKGKIIPGLWVNPSPDLAKLLFEALDFAVAKNIRVLKTSASVWAEPYSSDPSTWDSGVRDNFNLIANYAKKHDAVLQIHTGSGKSDIKHIEQLMRFIGKDVTLHLVHMGNNASGLFYLIPRLKDWIEEGFNVVADTSWACGFGLRWLFQEIQRNKEIADRVMFASDEPWGIFDAEYSKVASAFKDNDELLQKLFWQNAERIYSKRSFV